MFSFPIVDSHFHIWDLNNLRYPWLDTRGILNNTYLFSDYLKQYDGWELEASVYVEVTSTDYKKEADWVSEQAKTYNQIKGVVSWGKVEDPDFEADLARMQKNPLIKGVRRMLKKAESREQLCVSAPFIKGMRLLPKYNMIYDMGIVPEIMDSACEMIRQCPDVKFVVEHCAEPDIKGGGFDFWAEGMTKMSALDNVYIKLSGFLTKADRQKWTVDDLRPYMEYAVEKFGYDRVMYGSDWPPVIQVADIKTWLEICEQVFEGESRGNLEKIFRKNAISFYGLDCGE